MRKIELEVTAAEFWAIITLLVSLRTLNRTRERSS